MLYSIKPRKFQGYFFSIVLHILGVLSFFNIPKMDIPPFFQPLSALSLWTNIKIRSTRIRGSQLLPEESQALWPKKVLGSEKAFSALLEDGRICSWGHVGFGGGGVWRSSMVVVFVDFDISYVIFIFLGCTLEKRWSFA